MQPGDTGVGRLSEAACRKEQRSSHSQKEKKPALPIPAVSEARVELWGSDLEVCVRDRSWGSVGIAKPWVPFSESYKLGGVLYVFNSRTQEVEVKQEFKILLLHT